MKKLLLLLLLPLIVSCLSNETADEIVPDTNSKELVYIIELSVKENVSLVEDFTQYLTDFIMNNESPVVYGYFVSNNGNKVTLIERWKNSQDAMQHGIDFINGQNFKKFFEVFELTSFVSLGNPSDELKKFNADNGFVINYRKSIGGFVIK